MLSSRGFLRIYLEIFEAASKSIWSIRIVKVHELVNFAFYELYFLKATLKLFCTVPEKLTFILLNTEVSTCVYL